MQLGIGGAEGNVAIALKRLGTDVSWVGRVGRDSLGELVVRELRAEGVDIHAVIDPHRPTGLMVKERRTTANTRVWYYRQGSAGSQLQPEDLPDTLIREAGLLHATGITPALSSSAAEATLHAMRTAHTAEVPVSFDLNFRSKLWTEQQAGHFYRQVLPLADIVFAGEEEAAIAVGETGTASELAERIAGFGPSQVIIKLGENGCLARIGGTEYSRKAVRVDVADTVGAGDGFVAGYLSEYLLGSSIPQRLTTAVSVGAFACMVPGDWEGMPYRSELELLSATEPVSR
jgi:2-dehydro-3-deoxygluconokinase